MEYFLHLSVMAMIISSISIFLIDYQKPETATDAENDQSPPNPSDLVDDSADEFVAKEQQEELQNSAPTEDNLEENALSKLHTTKNILKEIKRAFSMLWTTQKSTFSTNNF